MRRRLKNWWQVWVLVQESPTDEEAKEVMGSMITVPLMSPLTAREGEMMLFTDKAAGLYRKMSRPRAWLRRVTRRRKTSLEPMSLRGPQPVRYARAHHRWLQPF